MSYRTMPTYRPSMCAAQEFDGEKFHACEFVRSTQHIIHRCACGHGWPVVEREPKDAR